MDRSSKYVLNGRYIHHSPHFEKPQAHHEPHFANTLNYYNKVWLGIISSKYLSISI